MKRGRGWRRPSGSRRDAAGAAGDATADRRGPGARCRGQRGDRQPEGGGDWPSKADRLVDGLDRRTRKMAYDVESTTDDIRQAVEHLRALLDRLQQNPSDLIFSRPQETTGKGGRGDMMTKRIRDHPAGDRIVRLSRRRGGALQSGSMSGIPAAQRGETRVEAMVKVERFSRGPGPCRSGHAVPRGPLPAGGLP